MRKQKFESKNLWEITELTQLVLFHAKTQTEHIHYCFEIVVAHNFLSKYLTINFPEFNLKEFPLIIQSKNFLKNL